MSTLAQTPPRRRTTPTLPIEQKRGQYGMWCAIATEFSLFACLFVSYFYLGINKDRWAENHPPELTLALIMLVVLLASSMVLEWGSRQLKQNRFGAARGALVATILIGFVFLGLQTMEYRSHWKVLTPQSNSYGSIFYTITSFHGAHVIAGLLMLIYAAFLPQYGPRLGAPFRPYQTVSLYWHFVDLVWILVVLILYVIPHFTAHA